MLDVGCWMLDVGNWKLEVWGVDFSFGFQVQQRFTFYIFLILHFVQSLWVLYAIPINR